MTTRLQIAQEKWLNNTLAKKGFWLKQIKSAGTQSNFVDGVSKFLGLNRSIVSRSLPVSNFKIFQQNAEKFLPQFISGIKNSAKGQTWAKGMTTAFSTQAIQGPIRRIIRRRRRRKGKGRGPKRPKLRDIIPKPGGKMKRRKSRKKRTQTSKSTAKVKKTKHKTTRRTSHRKRSTRRKR